MLNKLYQVLVLTLAMNFLAVAAGVGWLWASGRLQRQRVEQIRDLLMAPVGEPVEVKLEEPQAPTTRPLEKLEEMLSRAAGRTTAEQVEAIQQAFDTQRSELDRRYRELEDLQRQVDLAKDQLARDRAAHELEARRFAEFQNERRKLAEDKGFQDSLAMYQALPPRQAKNLLMGLDDQTLARYLQAMQPRTASKILKEFKTPDETARIQRVLERVRQNQASAGS
ncbi:MAG: hypothetical protein NZ561_08045 [Phycisphaerae bacterium]|nr:hypothetical protein [Phycisphaerae bacterium]